MSAVMFFVLAGFLLLFPDQTLVFMTTKWGPLGPPACAIASLVLGVLSLGVWLLVRKKWRPSPEAAAPHKRRLAQTLVAVPGIVLLFFALRGSFTDYRHIQHVRQRAEARTAPAEATIVETHGLVSGKGLRIAEGAGTFSFTTASGQEVRVPYRGFSGSPGTKLPVRYDPRKPENCAGANDLFGFSDLLFDNAPFFVMGLYFLFLAMMLGRRRA